MKENSVAKRYARALVKTIGDETEYRGVKEELLEFKKILDTNHEFKAGMETMLFTQYQKRDVLQSIQEKAGFNQKTFNFLLSLVDENRMLVLDSIIQLLEEIWFETNGVEKLKVYSAVTLNKALEKKLVDQLEKAFDKKIVLEKDVDPALIAGIKIQRGLVFYDFSVEGNLKKLKQALLSETHPSE